MTLKADIQTILDASLTGDADKRSALGMARSFIDDRKEIEPAVASATVYARRDQLARELVGAIRGAGRDDAINAIQAARANLNAPHTDETMLGFRAARAARGTVGSVKKGEKLAGK